jgi:integrase
MILRKPHKNKQSNKISQTANIDKFVLFGVKFLYTFTTEQSLGKPVSTENRFNFTAPRIKAATCPAGKTQYFFWDAATPKLGLRVTASGSKSYIFEGWANGKSLRMTIGDYRIWTIEQAREQARYYQTLCDKGLDPRAEKKTALAAQEAERQQIARSSLTLDNLWKEYIEDRQHAWGNRHLQDHYKVAQRGGEQRKRGEGNLKPGPLASLLDVRLVDLTADRLLEWQDKNRDRPTRAALAYRLLKGFSSWCQENPGYADLLPHDALNARKIREQVHKSVKREDDCLQREQLPQWFKAARAYENPVLSAYFQTLLLTGARREELAGLRWEDVDFQWRSLTIRDKIEGTRTIPLTPYVAQLLQGLPRRYFANGKLIEWVFSSSQSKSGRIISPSRAHSTILAAAGLPHVTLHGLRRSFATLSEWVEAPAGVVAQIMGHKPSAIAEKHYRRRPLDLLRQWHTKIEAWILQEAGLYQANQPSAEPVQDNHTLELK